MGMLGWPHLLLIFAVVILLFGATKLPLLARSVGQSARAFKGEMRAMHDEDGTVPAPSASAGVDG
ncbi:preprotein translocase subunit TatA [Microbacterium mangrovi]|uniref:Sec-independent protein translocase protein TatA n=1 Tax=Microbacterium mangrovi TaxID=1348253 RepID=A0A0B1ZXC5_9MICO|nr:Sec-independent protein translocase subunit TatA [Microbacterium mangrovi]KHK95394.1 preprotein translocase subunit TatA [Microbacterium mangrovi]